MATGAFGAEDVAAWKKHGGAESCVTDWTGEGFGDGEESSFKVLDRR